MKTLQEYINEMLSEPIFDEILNANISFIDHMYNEGIIAYNDEALTKIDDFNKSRNLLITADSYNSSKGDPDKIKKISDWINKNYDVKKISIKYNKEYDTYIVNAQYGASLSNSNLKQLTNGEFIWGIVDWFVVKDCKNIINLIGAPLKYRKELTIENNDNLISLEGLQHSYIVDSRYSCLFIENNKNLMSYEFLPETNAMYWSNNGRELSNDDKKIIKKQFGINYIYKR